MLRVKSHQPDYYLILIIGVIVVFGLVMLSSASSVIAFQKFGDSNYFIKHQLLSFAIGVIALIVTSKIDYHQWKKYALPLFLVSIGLLIIVFMPGIGSTYLGATRWIKLGPFSFQPTEFVKLAFLIYLATWLEKRASRDKDFSAGFLPFLVLLGVVSALIVTQPDLGTMIVIAIIALSCYFVAGAPWRHIIWFILGSIGAVFALIKIAPYRALRFTVFLHPEFDPQGIGYHINQALLAIGSGGIFGLGLGHSRQKFNYLPEAAGDSIFAIIAEELGFIMVVLLILLFLFFMYRGFRIAKSCPDYFGKLLATGITAWFTVQTLINIGALTGLVPLTGIPLPFISYGGSSLVISLAAVGILINISKKTSKI